MAEPRSALMLVACAPWPTGANTGVEAEVEVSGGPAGDVLLRTAVSREADLIGLDAKPRPGRLPWPWPGVRGAPGEGSRARCALDWHAGPVTRTRRAYATCSSETACRFNLNDALLRHADRLRLATTSMPGMGRDRSRKDIARLVISARSRRPWDVLYLHHVNLQEAGLRGRHYLLHWQQAVVEMATLITEDHHVVLQLKVPFAHQARRAHSTSWDRGLRGSWTNLRPADGEQSRGQPLSGLQFPYFR